MNGNKFASLEAVTTHAEQFLNSSPDNEPGKNQLNYGLKYKGEKIKGKARWMPSPMMHSWLVNLFIQHLQWLWGCLSCDSFT